MSKSVKSKGSSLSKRDGGAEVRDRIKQLLYSVKEERQHIQNRIHQNDVYLQQLKQDYQLMKYDNDFQHLNAEEQAILAELSQGLALNNIDPQTILGLNRSQLEGQGQYQQLSKQDIIAIQQSLLDKLKLQLQKLENNK